MSSERAQTLELVLATALCSPDPVKAVRAAAVDPRLSDESRRALAAVDEDGLRISALLIARLRFERLQSGHPDIEAWLERDPEGFAATFRRYHADVSPTAFFPPDEARAFEAWLTAGGSVTG